MQHQPDMLIDHENLPANSIFADHYQVISKIGSGGMGVVYRVKHLLWNEDQALKVLRPNLSENLLKRFENQIEILRSLQHPNIVALHEFGIEKNGIAYLAMDLIDGYSLDHTLKNRFDTGSYKHNQTSDGSPLIEWTLEIARQLCDALECAHKKKIVHRDLKPSNIMITPTAGGKPHVTVLDFDIAKLIHNEDNQSKLTRTGELLGTALYMSPEQCLGAEIDFRSDIYSLGCVVFELLTGRPPYAGATTIAAMVQKIEENPPTLSDVGPRGIKFPRELERAIARMLRKKPEERYGSIGEVRADLEAVVQLSRSNVNRSRKLLFSLSSLAFVILLLVAWHSMISVNQPHSIKNETRTSIANTQTPIAKIRFLHNKQLVWLSFEDLENDCRIINLPEWSIGRITLFPDGPATDAVDRVATGEKDKIWLDLSSHTPVTILDRLDKLNPLGFGNVILEVYRANDSNLSHILKLKQLWGLGLLNSQITDAGLDQIVKKYPNLNIISLDRTRISSNGIKNLSNLKDLSFVRIEHFALGGKTSKIIQKFKGAWILTFRDCHLNGPDLSNVPSSSVLRILLLPDNPGITGRSLLHLKSLPSLQTLDLSGCNIQSDAISSLSRLKSLKNLTLNLSNWTDEEKTRLKQLMPNCAIQQSNPNHS